MDVPGHIVYGREAILCPRQVCQFRDRGSAMKDAGPFWWVQ